MGDRAQTETKEKCRNISGKYIRIKKMGLAVHSGSIGWESIRIKGCENTLDQ
jgi:hypothetical protein